MTGQHDPQFPPVEDNLESALDRVYWELKLLLVERQRKYGKSNISVFGEMGVLVRASDKFERLKNMLQKPHDAVDESVEDTWRDIANYAMIALLLRGGKWDLPLRENLPNSHVHQPGPAWAKDRLKED